MSRHISLVDACVMPPGFEVLENVINIDKLLQGGDESVCRRGGLEPPGRDRAVQDGGDYRVGAGREGGAGDGHQRRRGVPGGFRVPHQGNQEVRRHPFPVPRSGISPARHWTLRSP